MNRREFIKATGVVTFGLMLDGQPLTEARRSPDMKISAVKLYDGGFMMKSFACGGGLPAGAIKEEKLRSSLQNFVIDTGDEVILVDTGFPAEETVPVTKDSVITFGDKVANYVDALRAAGYEPEKVSKILVTHKHADHTGELRAFPNAKIFISRIEADDMKLTGDNVVRVDFTDGAYKNFDACQKIADGVYYIFAPGHTKGNSIVIADAGDKFYMIHGDVTYTDEALLENKLSVVFEDMAAARDTLNKVRAFINENKTVYLSTHTPLGYENLEAQKIMKLPAIEEAPVVEQQAEEKKAVGGTVWVCSVCGYEHVGDTPPEVCPRCKQPSTAFKKK
ncbi:MAG: MBL fold metallo-hydrolase [Selenomonadaceae bacterium]|nr:MBL fold metallo-hydrolase [Selenomonadaceae bacterium]